MDLLLMVQKGIRGGICHVIHRYGECNRKCMKDYDENKKFLCLKYCHVNISLFESYL